MVKLHRKLVVLGLGFGTTQHLRVWDYSLDVRSPAACILHFVSGQGLRFWQLENHVIICIGSSRYRGREHDYSLVQEFSSCYMQERQRRSCVFKLFRQFCCEQNRGCACRMQSMLTTQLSIMYVHMRIEQVISLNL